MQNPHRFVRPPSSPSPACTTLPALPLRRPGRLGRGGSWIPVTALASVLAGAGMAQPVLAAEANGSAVSPANRDGGEATPYALDKVVVTARKREELVQDVPIPETVLSGSTLERDNAVTLGDFAQKAPNLQVSATNSRQTSVALRGLGKNSPNEAIQSSVGLIVDDVVLTQAGMSYANFTDIDQVEVLRGPQGTLQGKNTTLGAIVIKTKAPSFTPAYTVEAGYGSRNTYDVKATATGPLSEGTLAYRLSAYGIEGDGPIRNQYSPLGGNWEGPNRYGGRLQFLLTQGEDLNARLILQYDKSREHGNLSPYISDPTTFADGSKRTITYSSRLARSYFGGYTPLIGDITRSTTDLNSAQWLPQTQEGASLIVNKALGDFTLTSITGYRYNEFDFRNDFDYTHFDIQTLSGTIGNTAQYTQELRLASPTDGPVDYQVGLFAHKTDSQTTSRTLYGKDAGAFYASNAQYSAMTSAQLQDSLNGVFNTTQTDPRSRSVAVFGQANWHLSDKATLTAGLRETHETVGAVYNKASTGGVAVTGNALAIRNAQQGTLYGYVDAGTASDNSLSWLLSPSYKLSEDVLLYASASHGTKSGAVQLDNNGARADVKPENSLDYELGIKTSLFNRSLFFNANVYRTQITDYQSQATIPSATSSTGYTSLLTNVGGVRVQGLEVDGAWAPTARLRFTFGAAYNNARYSDYKNATCPVELNVSTACDFTGRQVANAPRVTATLGVEYTHPLDNGWSARVFANDVYRSRANLSTTLSDYTWQDAYSVVNAGVGFIQGAGRYEVDLVARNLFDTRYAVNMGQYSNAAGVSEFWGDPRFVGVVFKARL